MTPLTDSLKWLPNRKNGKNLKKMAEMTIINRQLQIDYLLLRLRLPDKNRSKEEVRVGTRATLDGRMPLRIEVRGQALH